MKTRKLFW